MSASPLVTVLLPVWNGASLPLTAEGEEPLRVAIRSLARQEAAPDAPVPGFEVLAVDDGSTDGTAALLDALAAEYPCLRVLHRPHEGLPGALNAGLESARGALIARMDADDVCHPQRLALQAAWMAEHPETGLLATRVHFGGDRETARGFAHFVDWQNGLLDHEAISRNRFRDTPVSHPSVMFRRELPRLHGGYADGFFAEDWELWLRWLHAGVRMAKLPQELLVWNDPPRRATRSDSRYCEAANNQPSGWPAGWNATTPGIRGSTCWARARWRAAVWPPCGKKACRRPLSWTSIPKRSGRRCTACRSSAGTDCPGRDAVSCSTPSPPTAPTRMPPAGWLPPAMMRSSGCGSERSRIVREA